jgi:hypothetical protein
MSTLEMSTMVWGLAVIQVIGLVSAWLARASEGSRRETSCQRIFFACLGLMGLATMAAFSLSPGWWLTSGATLSVMILVATCDFERSWQPAG